MAELFQLAALHIRELSLTAIKGIAVKAKNFCAMYNGSQEHK